MSVYSDLPRAEFLQWAQAHAPIFTANAAAIGLTVAQASAFNTATTAAATALLAQTTAHATARDATETVQDAFTALRESAGDMVRLIRAFAESQTKPLTVYTTASIPPPATRTPMPPPGTPSGFAAQLLESGTLKLTWKCESAGTAPVQYEIQRALGSSGAYGVIGMTGARTFTDAAVPPGTTQAVYQVTASRTTGRGNPGYFTVRFGNAPGGGASVSVLQSAATDAGDDGMGSSGGAAGMSGSTVNGRSVQKTLPTGNGSANRV